MNTLSNHEQDSLKRTTDQVLPPLQEEVDELNLAPEDDVLDLAPEDDAPVPATTSEVPGREDVQLPVLNQSPFLNPSTSTWKVMIVDDDREIHEVTQLALQGFTFRNKPLLFLSAYSGLEAKELLTLNPDTALMLLDVVMETNDAGLHLVKYIRDTLQNLFMRIILRTGQPGESPEESVIVNYDINDYKLKTELTQRKLFVTLTTGLRAYHDLLTLELNKRFSKQILESIPVGVVVHNVDGSMHYANPRAIQLLGKGIVPQAPSEELVEVYQLCVSGTSQRYPSDRLPVVLALQGQMVSIDDIDIHQPTKIVPVEAWASPVRNEQGQVSHAIVAFQDITERKQAEQDRIRLAQEQEAKHVALRYSHEIEAKNATLERLNQDKNEFLGIAAHDLKNPLSAILGLSEMVVNDFDELPKEEVIECAKGINVSAELMFNLVINLLDVNRIEEGKFYIRWQPTDLCSLVQEILKSYQERAATKQIQLHYQLPIVPYVTLLDPNITRQVLDNLISNAIKYSPPGKQVYVRLLQKELTVRCEIQDEGPGLSEEDQSKLFGKFARLTTQPTGGEHSTGLGLFIVKKWITAMNGKVWCESELGKGATFIVEFVRMA